MPTIDIWAFQTQLTRRLTWWSLASIVTGALLLIPPGFWRGFGIQCLTWGVIDLAIAFFGNWGTEKRRVKLSPKEQLAAQPGERVKLAKILWLNTGLDVLYILGGLALAFTLGASDGFWRGNGWGIVLQGGFLFFFDLFHALKLR